MQSIIESSINSPLFHSEPLSKLIAEYATPTEFGIIIEKICEKNNKIRNIINIKEEEIISNITNFEPLSFELQLFFSELNEEIRNIPISIELREMLLEKMTDNITRKLMVKLVCNFSISFTLERFSFFCFLCGSEKKVLSQLRKKQISGDLGNGNYVSYLVSHLI